MSLVVRLKTGDAASQAPATLSGDDLPGGLPEPLLSPSAEPDELEWAALAPAAGSHLIPCPHCGSPNGLSASICWKCEAALVPQASLRRWLVPWPEGSGPVPVAPASAMPAPADEPSRAAPSARVEADPIAEHAMSPAPAPMPMTAAGGRRRVWEIGAPILALAGAAAVFLYFDAPAPIGGFGEVPRPAPPPLNAYPAPPAPPAPEDGAVAGGAPAAAADIRDAALRALAVEPEGPAAPEATAPSATPAPPLGDAANAARDATEPIPAAGSKAAQAGKSRGTPLRPSSVATAPHLHKPERSERPVPLRQAPAPARSCTQTVAALGLCTPPPAESHE